MQKKQILGTHYSIREDGVVWDDKHNKELKGNGKSVSISFSIRKLMTTYFPTKMNIPEVEGVEHKMIEGHQSYQIYSNGKVFSRKQMKFMSPNKDGKGHLVVQLDGQMKKVHRLVYQAFVGPIPVGKVIHHEDFCKENNTPSNLRCLTPQQHSKLHGDLRDVTEQQIQNLNRGRQTQRLNRLEKNSKLL